MAISFVGTTTSNGSTIGLPDGWQVNDIALMFEFSNLIPSGWVKGSSTGSGVIPAYRILQTGDTTWSRSSGTLVVYRGVNLTYPISGISMWVASSATTTAPLNTLNTSVTTSLVVGGLYASAGGISVYPTGTTNRGTSGSYSFVEANTTGEYAGGTWTITSTSNSATAAIALRPDTEAINYPQIIDIDTASGTVTSNSTTWTLTYPTNLASGDLVLALMAFDGDVAYNSGLWPNVGWLHGGWSATGQAVSLTVHKMVSDGTQTGTFNITSLPSEQGAWMLLRIPAGTWYGTLGTVFGDSSTSGSVEVGLATTSTGLNPDPPSYDPANWGTENTLWIALMAADTSRTVSAYPSSPDTFTNTGYLASGGSNGATLAWARLEKNASSVDPGTFTISNSDDWAAATIAIRGRQYFSVVAQANAQITGGYKQSYAQARGTIKAFNIRSYAQSLAGIKVVANKSYAQSQAKIITTSTKYAQANSQIKNTNSTHAQAQSQIKTTYQGYAQGLAKLQVNGNKQYAQALADILGATNTRNSFGQANALIGVTTNLYSFIDESVPDTSDRIIGPPNSQNYYEAQLTSTSTPDYLQDIVIRFRAFVPLFLQAGVSVTLREGAIERTYKDFLLSGTETEYVYNLTPAEIASITDYSDLRLRFAPYDVTTDERVVITWAQVQIPSASGVKVRRVFAQAQAQISGAGQAYAQAQAHIKITGIAYAQAQAQIKQAYQSYAQANAYIKTTDIRAYAQAQAHIKTTYQVFAQAQARIKTAYQAYAQASAWIEQTTLGYGQAQGHIKHLAYQAYAQAQGQIKQTYQGHAQSQAQIEQAYQQFAQAQAQVKRTYQAYAQGQAQIKQTYQVFAQANAKIILSNLQAYAQSQAQIKVTYQGYAQAQGKIILSGNLVYAQALAQIKTTYQSYAQVQAQIKATSLVYAQALAQIEVSYSQHAQAQAWIKSTYQAYAQAQVSIYIPIASYNQFAQAQATIKQAYQGYGQSQSSTKSKYLAHAQAPSWIKQTYPLVAGNETIAQDSFTETGNIFLEDHTPEIGGSWVRRINNAKWSIDATSDRAVPPTSWDYSQYSIGPTLSNGYVQAYTLPGGAGYSQLTIRQITSTLNYYYAATAGALWRITGGNVTLLSYYTGTGDYVRVQATGSSPTSLKVEARASVGQLGTGWQLETTDNTAGNNAANTGYVGIWGESKDDGDGYTISTGPVDDFIAVSFGSGIIGPTFAQSQATIRSTYQKHSQAQATVKSTYQAYVQANTYIKTTGLQAFAQGQAQIKQTYQTWAQANAHIRLEGLQVYGQALATIKIIATQIGQSQALIKRTEVAYAQAQSHIKSTYLGYAQAQGQINRAYTEYAQVQASIIGVSQAYAQAQAKLNAFAVNAHAQAQTIIEGSFTQYAQAQAKINAFDIQAYGQSQVWIKTTYNAYAQAQAQINATYLAYAQGQAQIKTSYQVYGQAQAQISQTYQAYAQANAYIKVTDNSAFAQAQASIKSTYLVYAQAHGLIVASYYGYAQAQSYIIVRDIEAYAQAGATIMASGYMYAQAEVWIYIPQIARPIADISNDGNWVGTVRD